MFGLAVKAGLLPSRPAITLLREDNVREGFCDPPEFGQLLAQLRVRDAAVGDLVEFGYLTCLRRGNALGALWTWFKLSVEHGAVTGGSVCLPGAVTKNGKPLSLVLTGPLLALVARRWALRVAECPYVFHRGGRAIRDFRAAWLAACKAVGLSTLFFHDLRRSGARNFRKAGVDESVIMRIGAGRRRARSAATTSSMRTTWPSPVSAWPNFSRRRPRLPRRSCRSRPHPSPPSAASS
jgi:integrase